MSKEAVLRRLNRIKKSRTSGEAEEGNGWLLKAWLEEEQPPVPTLEKLTDAKFRLLFDFERIEKARAGAK